MIVIHQPKSSGTSLRKLFKDVFKKKANVNGNNTYFKNISNFEKEFEKESDIFFSHAFPTNESLNFIKNFSKNNKVIILSREPSSSAISMIRGHKDHSLIKKHSFDTEQIYNILKWFNESWNEIEGENIIKVSFENLTGKSFKKELIKIYDFLDVPNEKRIFNYPHLRKGIY